MIRVTVIGCEGKGYGGGGGGGLLPGLFWWEECGACVHIVETQKERERERVELHAASGVK